MTSSELANYYTCENVGTWDKLIAFYNERFQCGGQWVFRGQGNRCWPLKSSLDRDLESFAINRKDAALIERGLIRRFRRQCHQYISQVPDDDEKLEWLALMQHHGAPTRLLDFSYSFFAALFFAIEKPEECGCAVWAIDTEWLKIPINKTLRWRRGARRHWRADPAILQTRTFKELFLRNKPIPIVGAVTPQRLSSRLVIQQGTFLCPGDVTKSFEENLISVLSNVDAVESRNHIAKLTIPTDLESRKEILLHLQRMNMNQATLFPGLDGFARSLRTELAHPEILLSPGYEDND